MPPQPASALLGRPLPEGRGEGSRCGTFPLFTHHSQNDRHLHVTARESQPIPRLPFSLLGRKCRQADERAARRVVKSAGPDTPSGHPAPPLAQARQNATAVIFRTGSGGRLTSRRCHEDTWPFFSLVFSIRLAEPPPGERSMTRQRLYSCSDVRCSTYHSTNARTPSSRPISGLRPVSAIRRSGLA